MHQEIEKLIDLTLTDGKLSEKEKNVIIKKAKELGEDIDELEIIIDAKLQQLEIKKPINEKVGNIKTCPACGASLKALDVKCSSCGHQFTDLAINSSLTQLKEKLLSAKNENERINIIKNFTPNKDKEATIDTLHYLLGQVVSENLSEIDLKTNNILKQKSQEIISRTMIYFKNDTEFKGVISEFDKNMDEKYKTSEYFKIIGKQKQKRSYVYTTLAFVIFFGVFIIIKKLSPDLEDKRSIVSKIWPIWLILSILFLALGSYFSVDYKKHKKRFPFLENYK